MARGRKPKPLELAHLDNRGHRPLPDPLPGAGELDPEPPAVLGEAGAELWRELVAQLSAAKALHEIDRAALLALCQQWDRATHAAEVLDEQGLFAKGSMGQLVEHPALRIEARAHALLLKFASEYAATPVARARIATAKQISAQASEFDEITGDLIEEGEVEEIDGSEL